MHLHRLTLSAVGPFAGEHTIDFAALSAGGIFLLEGPTGAGKSTLVDAVVYALYGDVASASTSKDRIRSGFADPATESVVDLVFETASGVFRVRRTPEWDRPKRRGTGTTRQQSSVSLWRLATPDDVDGGEHVSNRLDEVGHEVRSVVGLSREQFVQTIVLPQGEFATFLKAAPERRREVLQKVFGTEQFDAVQARLVVMRGEARARIEAAQGEIERIVATFLGATGPWDDADPVRADLLALARGEVEQVEVRVADSEPSVDAELIDLSGLVALVVAQAEAAAAAATEGAGAAHEVCDAARDAVTRARARVEAVARRARLLIEQRALADGVGAQQDRVLRQDAARRAGAVTGVLAGLDKAVRDAERAATALADVEERLAADPAMADLPLLDDDALAGARDAAQHTAGGLAQAQTLTADRATRAATLATKEERAADVAAALVDLTTHLDSRPAARQILTTALEAARVAAHEGAGATQRLTSATRTVDAAKDAFRLEAARTAAESQIDALRRAAERAVAEEAAVRTARIAGIAGELATGLAPGDPCPVCGGTEHPAPAGLSDTHPGAAQVAEAEERRKDAEKALGEAASALEGLTARAHGAAELAGNASVEDAEAGLAQAQAAVEAANEAEAEHARLAEALKKDADEELALRGTMTTLHAERSTLTEAVRALRTRIEEDDAALLEARGDFASVADRLEHLAARTAGTRSLLDARAARGATLVTRAAREAEVSGALAEHGFSGADAVREAALPADRLAVLDRAIAEHLAATTKVEHALRDPDLLAVLTDLPEGLDPDDEETAAHLDALELTVRAALAEAEEARRTRDAEAGLARRRAADGAEQKRALDAVLASHAAARAEAAPVIRMADLAAGAGTDNPRRLTLGTYVLLRRFEEVVAVANERLDAMSDGRYALERSDVREQGGGLKQGLALRVRDATIDATRDPRTLSGGETFYVSLALALALAQVVTAEAGGVDLGTLFVDEGFGTLDANVLELVLRQLGSLHEEGRVVGIISHVDALKTAIAERIEVRRTPQGPSTLRVLA